MEYVSSIRSIYGVLAQAVAHLENWEAAVCCMYIYSYVCVCVYMYALCRSTHCASLPCTTLQTVQLTPESLVYEYGSPLVYRHSHACMHL